MRGWSFGGALRVAFEQLYVSKAEEELQLNSSIRDAFEDSLHDATATPATVELYRAACWPLHLTVEDAARNAVLFGVLRDASGLLSLLNTPALVAGLSRNVWLPIRSGLAPSGWEGCYPPSHDAVLLTAGLSRVMAAVPILVERSSLADEMTRSRLLEALLRALRLLEDGSGSGGHVLAYPALFLKRLFEQETRGRILALQASLLPSLGLDKAVANLAPSGLIMTAGSIKPTLLSTQQDAPLVEELKRAARKLKALVTTVRSACLLELSTQTVRDSEGVNTLLELSYWRRAHPKVSRDDLMVGKIESP